MNPFYTTYTYIPFDQIKEADYEPAMLKGIEEEDQEIDRIVNNPDAPTFENTIEAMERSGQLLEKVTTVFFNLLSAETTDFLDELAQKMSPILSEHSNNIMLNEGLFKRVKMVYDDHASDQFARLNPEQKMLLTNTYEGFMRHGALLSDEQKEQLRRISAELGVLSLQFSQNKLKDTNDFVLHLTDDTDLEGLPDSAIDLGLCVHASSAFLYPLPHLLCTSRTKGEDVQGIQHALYPCQRKQQCRHRWKDCQSASRNGTIAWI